MDVHHVRIAAQGDGPQHPVPVRGEDRRARVADLADLRGIHPVAGQEDRDALLKGQANGAGPDVALGPAVAGHAPPPLEVLHEVGIAHDVKDIPLRIRKGHAEAGILEQAVQGIDLLLGQRVEDALGLDALPQLIVGEPGGFGRAVEVGVHAVAGRAIQRALDDDFEVGEASQAVQHGLHL